MGTGHTVATLADASELPGVTVAQVNYSTVTDGEVRPLQPRQPTGLYGKFGSCFCVKTCVGVATATTSAH